MHRNWMIAASGLGLIVSLMAGTLLSPALSRGPFATLPRTYPAAVMTVLDRHGIPYRDVQVRTACPSYADDCFTQNVLIVTTTRPVAGSIVRRRYYEGCAVRLPTLGLPHVPLPPLGQDSPWVRVLRHWMWQLRYALSPIP